MKKDLYLPPPVFSAISKENVGNFRFRDSLHKIKSNIRREFVQNGREVC